MYYLGKRVHTVYLPSLHLFLSLGLLYDGEFLLIESPILILALYLALVEQALV